MNVKNNLLKFLERFSWVLSDQKELNLKSKNYGGRRYNRRVFTEQEVATHSTILKSKVTVQVSIQIMDGF